MLNFKRIIPSQLVLALVLPLGLAACGSSSNAPSASLGSKGAANTGSSVASNSTGTGTTTGTTGGTAGPGGGPLTPVTTPVASTISAVTGVAGTLGDGVGGTVTAVGNTVAATGTSLENGALSNPAGITLLNSSVTDTTTKDIVDANVLSNTAPSAAPVQANVLANGQIISASIANPASSNIPVVSPVVNGVPSIVSTVPAVTPVVAGVTPVLSGATTQVAAVTAPLTAPLNPLLDVQVGKTTLIGSPTTPAAINVGVVTPANLVNVAVTAPSPTAPNPLTQVSSLTGSTSPLSAVTAPVTGVLGGITGSTSGGAGDGLGKLLK